jgi:hypothetical protein
MGNRPQIDWAILFILGGLLLTMGCGGSGGGDGLGYEGNREAAALSGDNAQVLAVSAYDSQTLEGPFGSVASLTDSTDPVPGAPKGRPTLLSVAQALTSAVHAARRGEGGATTSARALEEDDLTINGSCGGEASFSIDIDNASGVFAGEFDFNEYCHDGTALQGHASFQGRVDPETDQLDYFSFSFSNLIGTADGQRFRLDGDLTLRVDAANDQTRLTMDLLLENSVAGETLWLHDFTLSVTDGVDQDGPYEAIAFSGRIYHPVHGYVDVHTDVAFRIEEGEESPSEGVLTLTGADDASVTMTALPDSQYQLEADLDGDGDYDWGPETYSWDG